MIRVYTAFPLSTIRGELQLAGRTPLPTEFPEQLRPMRAELETYYRELPRLLEEGEEGRYVVVKGASLHGVWDTFRDARQHGGEVFGLEQFVAQQIDRRYLSVFEQWFGPLPDRTEGEE